MIISFDLDDTLFVNPSIVKTEKELIFPLNLIYKERLRSGTVDLLLKIRKSGIKLWIYTTSYRSEKYIKALFKRYGIKIDNVINGERHMKEVQGERREPLPSKYPSKYKIDLHIDDDISVFQNGKTYGFKVFLLKENNTNWDAEIWETIEKIQYRTK